MKFHLSHKEKELINHFRKLKYPAIYKTDRTDNILFIELVDFNVCSLLLNGEAINPIQYNEILSEYEKYLKQTDITSLDSYAIKHYDMVNQIMKMFVKYCNSKQEL